MSALFALISLLLGLHFLKENLIVSIILTLFFVIFIFYRFKWKKSIFFLSLFLIGVLFAHVPRVYNSADNSYSGVVVSTKQNYFLLYSHGERFYVYEKNTTREIGDFLEISGEPLPCEFTTYESQIDFNSYLHKKGVSRQLQADVIQASFQNPIRMKMLKTSFLNHLDENSSALADAMLFNYKDYSNSVIDLADSINLIFLMSTTGIYFSFFFRSIKKLFYLKFEERTAHILSLILVGPYVLLSFPKVGVIRVFGVNLFNMPPKKESKPKKSSFLTRLSIVQILILILNPFYAYDSGYLIGFLLTLFLSFFRISYRTKLSFKSRMVTPILVYLFIQPMFTFRSGTIHLLAFFEQIILIPVNEVFIVLSVFGLIGLSITFLINFNGKVIYFLINIFHKIDLNIPIADYGDIYIFLFYILFFTGLYFFEAKRYRHVKYVAFTALSLFLIGIMPVRPFVCSGVYFINVGQGDSIIIQDHFNAVMIDTGGNLSFDMAKETLIPFMNKKQIYYLDALITSHDDFDHSGASQSLIESFKVNRYLNSPNDFPYSVGNIKLENLNIYPSEDENESSLVLYMEFYNQKYLFTGDAPKEIEQLIIKDNPNLTCDILKVGHHGSKTSTDESFIRQIKPKEGIISVGRKNRYGHPNQEVLDTLSRYDVRIRRTDLEGTISYLSYFQY